MPVSEPSYFPPQRGNLSVIGLNAGTKALGGENFLAGSQAGNNSTSNKMIIIGNFSAAGGITGPDGMIIIGNSSLSANTEVAANELPPILIGTRILQNTTADVGGAVIIGNASLNDAADNVPATDVVIVGSGCLPGTALGEVQNFTVIGSQTLKSATTTLCGSLKKIVCVGDNIAPNLSGNVNSESLTIIGSQAAAQVTRANSVTVLGSSALGGAGEPTKSIVIGEQAAEGGGAFVNSILIGAAVAPFVTGASSSIVIGASALASETFGATPEGGIAIGNKVASNIKGLFASVIIGSSAMMEGQGSGNDVIIGASAASALPSGIGSTGNVIIGVQAAQNAGLANTRNVDFNVVIGIGAGTSFTGSSNIMLGPSVLYTNQGTFDTCVLIGAGAGAYSDFAPVDSQFLLELGVTGMTSNTSQALAWGLFPQGGLVLGNSIANQRELDGSDSVNIVKLIAGTKGAGAPVDGGYFYVTGANNDVHWLNSAGFDSTLSDNAVLGTLILSAAAPAAAAGQVALGSTTATAATAGAHGAAPAQVAGYLVANVAGTAVKIPYYAN